MQLVFFGSGLGRLASEAPGMPVGVTKSFPRKRIRALQGHPTLIASLLLSLALFAHPAAGAEGPPAASELAPAAGQPGASKPPAAEKSASAEKTAPAAAPSAPDPGPTPARPAPPPPATPVEATGTVREAEPSLYYLKDKDGNLQPVPNFKFEEFEEMVRRKHRSDATAEMPRFTLQSLSVSGVAKADRAELTAKVVMRTRDEQWVRVPLRLEQAALREPPQYEGTGQHFLHYESTNGYVSWIRGTGQEHTVTLQLLVPLSVAGDQTRLRLSTSRATTSELKLQVPMEGAAAAVSEGATLLAAKPSASGTELSVLGLGGDFELTWQRSAARGLAAPSVLEAVGGVWIKVDSRVALADARLTVRGFGAPFDRFQVRLPKGATLVPGTDTTYAVAPMDGVDADGRGMVEVRLTKKSLGPVEVRLSTRQPVEAAGSRGWIDLAGFEVLEAARQKGHIAVSAKADWQLVWGPSRGMRPVDQLPEGLQHEDLVAAFEYFSQPCALPARVAPRETRIAVEPEYVVLVDADQAHLEARWKYLVRGAKVSTLEVELGDWQVADVGPEGTVAPAGPMSGPNGMVSIPLVQPSSGPLELVLRARRNISREAKSLLISLPKPQATSVGAASLAVLPADNVELTPKPEATLGLVRQQTLPIARLPKRQQQPLFYRSEMARSVFAADFRVQPQSVTVEVHSQIDLEEAKSQVEQRLVYTVAYEPLDRLLLEVPRSLAHSDVLEVSVDGQRLPLLDPPESDTAQASETVRKRVLLPWARIGSVEIMVRFLPELQKLLPGASTVVRIPLIMPKDGKLVGNRLSITPRPGLSVEHREGGWLPVTRDRPDEPGGPGTRLTCPGPASQVVLAMHQEEQDAAASTVVTAAWVQTWVANGVEQGRAAYRLARCPRDLDLTLPATTDLNDLEIWLDQERIDAQVLPEGRVALRLPEETGPRTLEVRYHRSTAGKWGWLAVDFPKLGRETWIRRMYWQLVLPRDEHLVLEPPELTPEFLWGWYGLFWGRKPLWDQAGLETWIAARRLPGPSHANNCYLFSRLGGLDSVQVYTTPRAVIVLIASGAALLIGLTLIYVRTARHPAALLALAIALGAALLLYPEPTLLLAQAASLGVLLALLAALLRARSGRRGRALNEPPSSIYQHPSVRDHSTPEGPATTKTVPLPHVSPTSDVAS